MLQQDKERELTALVSKLSREEKILIVECILYDVRLDWAVQEAVVFRLKIAYTVCKELESDPQLGCYFKVLCEELALLFASSRPIDGRFFRGRFPDGYIGMDKLHGFRKPYELSILSSAFNTIVDSCLLYKTWIFAGDK